MLENNVMPLFRATRPSTDHTFWHKDHLDGYLAMLGRRHNKPPLHIMLNWYLGRGHPVIAQEDGQKENVALYNLC